MQSLRGPTFILLGLLALIAPTLVISSLATAESLPFPGGVKFQFKIDEMTDKKDCSVFTPMRGIQAAVYDSATVAIWVHENQGVVATDPAPMMRIDEASPIRLLATEKPRVIAVPPAKAREVIEALYTRRKIALRWYDFPNKNQKNFTVEVGDFGAAYDHGVKVCGWSRLNVKRRPLSKDPDVYKSGHGYLRASFGGSGGWTVTFMPEFGSCEISAREILTVFSSRHGHVESVLELGEMIFLDANGQEVGRVVHKDFSPAPITAMIAAARKAGEYGIIQLPYNEKVSLFGLLEAVQYAEKTCKVSVRSAIAKPVEPIVPPAITAPPSLAVVKPPPAVPQPVITPPVVTPPRVTSRTTQVAPSDTDPALAYYIILIQDKLEGNWTPPKMPPGKMASVNLSFTILRSGQIRELAVESSSGDHELDDSALRTVRLSAPLPPLPALYKAETFFLRVRFNFEGLKN